MFCLAFFQADAGPQSCVTFAGADAFQRPFASVINRRNAGKGKEQRPCKRQMRFFIQFAGNAVFIVVVQERVELCANGFQSPYIVGNLKEIMVIEPGIEALM